MRYQTDNFFWLKCFGVIYAISLMVFSFYTTTFFWGNHELHLLKFGTIVDQGFGEGRLTQFLLPTILFDNHILPIIGLLIGLVFFVLAVIILANMWKIPKNTFCVVSFALLIIITPYTMSQLYYVHTISSIFFWHLMVVLGFYFINKSFDHSKLSIYNKIIATTLWLFAISGYIPAIQMILTLMFSFVIKDIINGCKIRVILKKYFIISLCICCALMFYLMIIYYLRTISYIGKDTYNQRHLPILDIALKLCDFWDKPFTIFTDIFPYCTIIVNIMFLLLFMLFIVLCIKNGRYVVILPIILLFYAMFACAYISSIDIFDTYRINMFSVPYVIAFFYSFVLKNKYTWIKNIGYLAVSIVIFMFSLSCFETQKIWHLGNNQDEKAIERIRQELFKQIDFNKRYRLFIVGNLYGRAKFANKITFSRWQKEKYREFFTYQYYLSHYFSSGLFFTENSNPIYADVFYAFDGFDYENNDRIVLFTNNEYYTHEELVNYAFIANYRYIKQDMVNKLSARKNEKLILSDSDIVIYLSDDAFTEKIILYFFQKTHFNNEN